MELHLSTLLGKSQATPGFLGEAGGFYETGPTYFANQYQPTSAVSLKNASNILFNSCSFKHFGGTGLSFTNTQNLTINKSLFKDISGNAISFHDFSDTRYRAEGGETRGISGGIKVTNCVISDAGKDFFGSVGIFAIYGDAVIEHNELFNLPYSGIILGWFNSNNKVNANVRFNHIHHVMTELADGGAIYTLRPQNTLIFNNYIHDVIVNPHSIISAAHAGIYLDDGSNGISVIDNIVVPFEDGICYLRTGEICDPTLWGFYGPGYGNPYNMPFTSTAGHEDIVNNAGPKDVEVVAQGQEKTTPENPFLVSLDVIFQKVANVWLLLATIIIIGLGYGIFYFFKIIKK